MHGYQEPNIGEASATKGTGNMCVPFHIANGKFLLFSSFIQFYLLPCFLSLSLSHSFARFLSECSCKSISAIAQTICLQVYCIHSKRIWQKVNRTLTHTHTPNKKSTFILTVQWRNDKMHNKFHFTLAHLHLVSQAIHIHSHVLHFFSSSFRLLSVLLRLPREICLVCVCVSVCVCLCYGS